MKIFDNTQREELILEVLKAASDRITVKDFDIQCQLAPTTIGKAYYDRLRIAEQLIEEGLIAKIDDRLTIVANDAPDWLKKDLLIGSKISWEILETIDKNGRIKGKIDLSLLASIGLDGEKEVVRQLKKNLHPADASRIKHISLIDDSRGYDILSPSVFHQQNLYLLEVKTSSRPGDDFRFYISRNEARVAKQNTNWRLVAVIKQLEDYRILGHLDFAHFSHTLPLDSSSYSKWESASVVLPINLFTPGLP